MKKVSLIIYLLTLVSFAFSQSGVIFNKETFNFGYVLRGAGESKYRFNFQNKTQGIVQITKVYCESELLLLNWIKTSVERNDKGFVEIALKPSERLGEFTEKVIVYTSSNEAQPIVLTVMFNIVETIPEPKIEEYSEYFGFLAADGAIQSKKYTVFIESLANYILKKEHVTLQIESSMSPMSSSQEYSQSIAKKRAEDLQSKIIKSVSSYELDSKSVVFSPSVILIQGPVYSKKTQGKEECSKFQYIKVIKKD